MFVACETDQCLKCVVVIGCVASGIIGHKAARRRHI